MASEGASCPTCSRFFSDYGELLSHVDDCSQKEFERRAAVLASLFPAIDDEVAALFAPFGSRISKSEGKTEKKSSAELPEAIRDADAQEVIPGLFLGSISAARDEAFLSAARIRAIINCAAEARPLPTAKREAAGVLDYYIASSLDDSDRVDFSAEILKAAEQLHNAMEKHVTATGKKEDSDDHAGHNSSAGATADASAPDDGCAVLVHCAAGVSRSSTVLMAFLVRYRGFSLRDAALATKRARGIVYPNAGFWRTLFKVEEEEEKAAAARSSEKEGERFPIEALFLHRSRFDWSLPESKDAVTAKAMEMLASKT